SRRFQRGFEFSSNRGDPFFSVRLHAKAYLHAWSDPGALLHCFVDDHHVTTVAGWKERSTKRKSVDFAFHSKRASGFPYFRAIERNGDGGVIDAFSPPRFQNRCKDLRRHAVSVH